MDYEKEYKEAKDRATKAIMRCRPLSTEANLAVHYALSYVFPATTESEDERIRKNCIHFLELQKAHHADTSEIDDCIAYLEKQKEQKPTNSEKPNEWSEEDKGKLSAVISLMKSSRAVDPFYDKMCLEGWLKSLSERFNLPPKQEWSEEDEEKIDDIIRIICNARECSKIANIGEEKEDNSAFYNGLVLFLKSLHPHPKQEWSEKDEIMLLSAIEYVQTYPAHCQSVVNWLKSLRLRLHWKPSEEQMEALRVAAYEPYKNWNDKLQELYENLKLL